MSGRRLTSASTWRRMRSVAASDVPSGAVKFTSNSPESSGGRKSLPTSLSMGTEDNAMAMARSTTFQRLANAQTTIRP